MILHKPISLELDNWSQLPSIPGLYNRWKTIPQAYYFNCHQKVHYRVSPSLNVCDRVVRKAFNSSKAVWQSSSRRNCFCFLLPILDKKEASSCKALHEYTKSRYSPVQSLYLFDHFWRLYVHNFFGFYGLALIPIFDTIKSKNFPALIPKAQFSGSIFMFCSVKNIKGCGNIAGMVFHPFSFNDHQYKLQ